MSDIGPGIFGKVDEKGYDEVPRTTFAALGEDHVPQVAESFPELYVDPLDVKKAASADIRVATSVSFDGFSEGSQVAIYKFAGLATVKVRREALLIDSEDKVLRSKEMK